jgi:uncharacterized protein YecE (DUF72 family)
MAEDNKIKEELEALKKENEALKKEIEALKISNEAEKGEAPQPENRLSESERTFKAVKTDKKGKEKEVTAVLADVTSLRFPNRKVKSVDFMKDKELQKLAVEINHPLITIK